jgi:hypothetical protein
LGRWDKAARSAYVAVIGEKARPASRISATGRRPPSISRVMSSLSSSGPQPLGRSCASPHTPPPPRDPGQRYRSARRPG